MQTHNKKVTISIQVENGSEEAPFRGSKSTAKGSTGGSSTPARLSWVANGSAVTTTEMKL